MADLDLKEEQNKQLIKLISDEDIEKVEEEIQFEVFKLAKKLKRKKITKSSNSSLKRSSTGSQKATQLEAKRLVRKIVSFVLFKIF